MVTYNVILTSWGGTNRVFVQDVTIEEAVEICESHNWEWDDGGYIWDMEIEKVEIEN